MFDIIMSSGLLSLRPRIHGWTLLTTTRLVVDQQFELALSFLVSRKYYCSVDDVVLPLVYFSCHYYFWFSVHLLNKSLVCGYEELAFFTPASTINVGLLTISHSCQPWFLPIFHMFYWSCLKAKIGRHSFMIHFVDYKKQK